MSDDPLHILKKITDSAYEKAQAKKQRKPSIRRPKPKPRVDNLSILTEEETRAIYDEVILDRELGDRSLRDFARICWPHMDGTRGIPFVENAWHSDCLADHIQAVIEGKIKKLLISIAPGFGKSSYVAVFGCVWAWIKLPYWKIAIGSYSYDFTKRDAGYCLKLIESKFFQQRWGHKFSIVKREVRNIENSFGGVRAGISVAGRTLGIRANIVIADDPLNILESDSELSRADVHFWWDKGMRTRGDKDLREIVVQQRLHQRDLIGYLRDEIGGYQELIIPAEYDPNRHCVTFTDDGTKFWEDPRKEPGELAFPQKFPKEFLDKQRGTDDKTRNMFSAMYMQEPVQPGGNIIKTAWFRYYTCSPEEQFAQCSAAILSCDLAVKSKLTSSYTVIQIWGIRHPNLYLIDQLRRRMSFTESLTALTMMIDKWTSTTEVRKGPMISAKLIEDKASGPDVVDVLRKHVQGLILFDANDNKEERMHAISWLWEAGNIYVPGKPAAGNTCNIDYSHVPWMVDWADEITKFPKSSFTDQAVTMSQALAYISKQMKKNVGMPGLVTGGPGKIANIVEQDWLSTRTAKRGSR